MFINPKPFPDFVTGFKYRQILNAVILLGISMLAPSKLMAEENFGPAIAVVEKLHETLLNNMQNSASLGYNGRYEVLSPVIKSSFDTPLIAKVVLGRNWKGLDTKQQSDFVELFNRLSVSTYASRFDNFSGESFKTIKVDNMKKGRILVKTELVRPDDEPVNLDYIMQLNNGQWYIISVIADGVNDLSLKRAEYSNVIKDKGFNSLVSDIEDKIKMYENGNT